jgi:hypothetical protein
MKTKKPAAKSKKPQVKVKDLKPVRDAKGGLNFTKITYSN